MPSVWDEIDAGLRLVDQAIWIITAVDGPRRGGLVATWVSRASLDPREPVVVAALAPNHYTAELIEASEAFAAHLLHPSQADLCWRFALGSGRSRDKLQGLDLRAGETGAPILQECLAWFECRLARRYPAGDRTFFWGRVVAGGRTGTDRPLTEGQLISAASPDQRRQLLGDRQQDIELQRPLRDAWLPRQYPR